MRKYPLWHLRQGILSLQGEEGAKNLPTSATKEQRETKTKGVPGVETKTKNKGALGT